MRVSKRSNLGGCQVRPLTPSVRRPSDTYWRLLVENLGAVGWFTCSLTSWFVVNPPEPTRALDTDRVVTRLPWLPRVRESAMEVYVCWDLGRACAVRPRYVSVKCACCWLILVGGRVPADVCAVKLILERSGITSLCTLRAGSWNHRAPTAPAI